MENIDTQLWVDKYRPTNLDDYVVNPEIRKYFQAMLDSGKLQNFLLAGIQGSGKTTLAKIVAKQTGAETLFIPCATEGTLDVLRTKISEFCNAMSFDGKPKLVILDELDSASSTGQNNFQLGLRTVIESAQSDTRFICTCNFPAKIVPAIMSRCPLIPLRFDQKDLLVYIKRILDSEKIKYTKESLKSFIEEAFHFYPDCRRIVNYLQFCCGSGELVVKLNKVANSGKNDFMEKLAEKINSNAKLLDIRQFYLQNKEKISDYVALGSDLFNWAVDNDIIDVDGVLKLTDLLFALNTVIDKEVGFFGMVTAVMKYRKA